MGDGGKGSRVRPAQVDKETLAKNWEMIFGKKNKKEEDLEDLGSAATKLQGCKSEVCCCTGACKQQAGEETR